MVDDREWALRFPALFAPQHVDYAHNDVQFTTAAVPESLIARIHLVAVTPAGGVLVCRSVQGWRFLPGGTREPDESLARLCERELGEEAGARMLEPAEIFGAHRATSSAATPFRPHLPHPVSYWAYAVVPVVVEGPPSCPVGGELIVEVPELEPLRAAEYLQASNSATDRIHGDVVLLAWKMGLLGRFGG